MDLPIPLTEKPIPMEKENTNLLSYYQSLCQFRTTYRTDFQKDLRLVCAQNNCFAFARETLFASQTEEQASFIECSGKKQLCSEIKTPLFSKWNCDTPLFLCLCQGNRIKVNSCICWTLTKDRCSTSLWLIDRRKFKLLHRIKKQSHLKKRTLHMQKNYPPYPQVR